MDADGASKDDVKVPDSDLGQEIEKAFEEGKDLMVTIVAAMGRSLWCLAQKGD
jgi:translation initiation factor 5A